MITGYSNAQSDSTTTKKKLSFKDPEDGALDLSQFLLEANGVLPIIIPITEPAVGYGGELQFSIFIKGKNTTQGIYGGRRGVVKIILRADSVEIAG